jgi:hypothetical protein
MRVKAPLTQIQRIPLIRAFSRGQRLGSAKGGFVRTHGEGARDATLFPRTRHKFPSPPDFSSFTLSLVSLSLSRLTLSPQTGRRFLSRRREVHWRRRACFIAAYPPPQPLHQLLHIVVCDQASLHRLDFNRRCSAMSVSPQITLNPHILQLIYLFTVRRRALADMHSGYARVRVQSD